MIFGVWDGGVAGQFPLGSMYNIYDGEKKRGTGSLICI